jgi:hypothetical protein
MVAPQKGERGGWALRGDGTRIYSTQQRGQQLLSELKGAQEKLKRGSTLSARCAIGGETKDKEMRAA